MSVLRFNREIIFFLLLDIYRRIEF